MPMVPAVTACTARGISFTARGIPICRARYTHMLRAAYPYAARGTCGWCAHHPRTARAEQGDGARTVGLHRAQGGHTARAVSRRASGPSSVRPRTVGLRPAHHTRTPPTPSAYGVRTIRFGGRSIALRRALRVHVARAPPEEACPPSPCG